MKQRKSNNDMGGAIVTIKDSSIGRLRACWGLIDAAIVLFLFGEVEMFFRKATVKPSPSTEETTP